LRYNGGDEHSNPQKIEKSPKEKVGATMAQLLRRKRPPFSKMDPGFIISAPPKTNRWLTLFASDLINAVLQKNKGGRKKKVTTDMRALTPPHPSTDLTAGKRKKGVFLRARGRKKKEQRSTENQKAEENGGIGRRTGVKLGYTRPMAKQATRLYTV